jgi:hypothetical protein
VTPEEAAAFYEDDEDPREVFAKFDGRPGTYFDPRQLPASLKEPATDAGQPAERVRQGLDYIRTTYGGDAT